MEIKVLLAYASTHGSTQEVAKNIAETLRNQGLVVDLQPMRNVRSLDGYSAVVLGVPLYMFHWHRDALRFLSRHRKVLSKGLPTAIFSGGPFSPKNEEQWQEENAWQEVKTQVEKELEKFPWLKPFSVEIIGGRFDPARLRLPWSLLPALKQIPASDLRDWGAIRHWADSLVPKLQLALPQ